MKKEFIHKIKIYYEDTDSGGVVYYANYLKYLERARSEIINFFKLSNNKLLKNHKVLIMVRSCKIQYKKFAILEDKLKVISRFKHLGKASFKMIQIIKRNKDLILTAEVELVTVNIKGKVVKIPNILNKKLKHFINLKKVI
tara:strand:+ start:328 stop:750 length:423 start_codon:yes stop_codon:yes gene_type:complete